MRAFNTAEICVARDAERRALGLTANFCPDRKVVAAPREEVNAAVCIVLWTVRKERTKM